MDLEVTYRVPRRIEVTGDRQADEAQRHTKAVLDSLVKSGIALGRHAFDTDASAPDISFSAATAKRVMHGLQLPANATPSGIFPVYTSAACTFYVTAWDESTVTVMPSATCTARLWVYP